MAAWRDQKFAVSAADVAVMSSRLLPSRFSIPTTEALVGHAVPAAPEARIAKWLMAASTVICLLAWSIEMAAGVITPWDRWLVPGLALLFSASAVWIHWWPQLSIWPRAMACLGLNAYFVISTLLLFNTASDASRIYQLLTGLYWMPLGYATVFIFLPTRVAVGVSLAVAASMYIPLGLALRAPQGDAWGPELSALIGMTAVAQVAYIIVLLAVATMRVGYHRTRERLRVTEELVNTDLLTGLKSRRASETILASAIDNAGTSNEPMTVMLVDIDHFKRINDRHGHAMGDRALAEVGRLLASQLRTTDLVGRWGGEEFLVIAPHTHLHDGTRLGERLRQAVASFGFPHGEPVTVSIGLAPLLAGDNSHQLVARADRALYRAKDEGRNRLAAERLALAAAPV